jgi:hypothetical protein
MIFTSFDAYRVATPLCFCAHCHHPVQRAGRAIVLVVDDGKPLVNVTFCLHVACEAAFVAQHPPSRGARWVTFPLAAFLATLLKNTRAREGAEETLPLGH